MRIFTSIAPDHDFRLDKQWRNEETESRKHTLKTSKSFSHPWQISQSAVFPEKSSILSYRYVWIGMHAEFKSSRAASGLANARPPCHTKFSNAPPLLHSKGLYKSDLPTLTVWLWDSQFGMPSHGLTVLPLNLTVNQKTLKLPKNSAKYEGISNIIFFVRKNRYNVSSIETSVH